MSKGYDQTVVVRNCIAVELGNLTETGIRHRQRKRGSEPKAWVRCAGWQDRGARVAIGICAAIRIPFVNPMMAIVADICRGVATDCLLPF